MVFNALYDHEIGSYCPQVTYSLSCGSSKCSHLSPFISPHSNGSDAESGYGVIDCPRCCWPVTVVASILSLCFITVSDWKCMGDYFLVFRMSEYGTESSPAYSFAPLVCVTRTMKLIPNEKQETNTVDFGTVIVTIHTSILNDRIYTRGE